jgi:GlcNAc-PI de-N-acetylase
MTPAPYDVLAFGAHPDDLEAVMGGTAAKMAAKGRSILFVDLCDGEPARHAGPGERGKQTAKAASILGVDRCTLRLRDRLIRDTNDARLAVARLIRLHRPRWSSRQPEPAFTPITKPSRIPWSIRMRVKATLLMSKRCCAKARPSYTDGELPTSHKRKLTEGQCSAGDAAHTRYSRNLHVLHGISPDGPASRASLRNSDRRQHHDPEQEHADVDALPRCECRNGMEGSICCACVKARQNQ